MNRKTTTSAREPRADRQTTPTPKMGASDLINELLCNPWWRLVAFTITFALASENTPNLIRSIVEVFPQAPIPRLIGVIVAVVAPFWAVSVIGRVPFCFEASSERTNK